MREVDVLGLGFREDHWLLAAFCHLRRGIRLFRVERIRAARVAARRGRPPEVPGFDARAFSTRAWLDPGARPLALACVRLGPELARAWGVLFPGALSELLPDGGRLCHFRVSRVPGLEALVGSLGGLAELVPRGREAHPRPAHPPPSSPVG